MVLAVCGAILLAAFMVLSATGTGDGTPVFLGAVGIASLAYGVAIVHIVRRESAGRLEPGRRTRVAIWMALALALAMRLPALTLYTGTGNDMFRYLWDARLQREGLNPYLIVPSDPRYASIHTDQTRRMNNLRVPSPYPPAAQLFFRLVTAVADSTRGFRVALIGADILASILLMWLLRAHGRTEWLALVYAWHPLTILESARNGHLDALGALLLVASALALRRSRPLAAVTAFVTAVAVKFLPLVLLPLFWRRIRVAHAAAGVMLLLLFYAPYLREGAVPVGSVANVVDRFRFNGPLFGWMADLAGPRAAAAGAVAAGLAIAAYLRLRAGAPVPDAWAWPMAITLAGAPLVYPWYLVWFVPFLWGRYTTPLLVWTILIPALYLVWNLPPEAPWRVPRWLLMVEYGAVLGAGIVSAGALTGFWRRRRNGAQDSMRVPISLK